MLSGTIPNQVGSEWCQKALNKTFATWNDSVATAVLKYDGTVGWGQEQDGLIGYAFCEKNILTDLCICLTCKRTWMKKKGRNNSDSVSQLRVFIEVCSNCPSQLKLWYVSTVCKLGIKNVPYGMCVCCTTDGNYIVYRN